MEPLIDLPVPAKARIKAREALAKDEFERVRRACGSNVARARRQWGNYFDLFRDNLGYVVEEADASIRQAATLCAQYVFNAHAVEYRAVLPSFTELESVLGKLRDEVIREYGEHTRVGVEYMEAHELEEASAGRTGAPEVAAKQAGATPPSWIDLRTDFLRYAVDQAGLSAVWRWIYSDAVMTAARAKAAAEGDDPYAVLRRMYQNADLSARPPAPEGQWLLEGGTPGSQDLFRVMAGRAARKLAVTSGERNWRLWLDQLRHQGYAPKMPDRRLNVQRGLALVNATVPYPRGFEDQRIDHVFEASADFCFARSLEAPEPSTVTEGPDMGSQPSAAEGELSDDSEQRNSDEPSPRLRYDQISPDDPNYDLVTRSLLQAWADSHGFVADEIAGRVSLSDLVDECVKTFDQGAQIHVALKGDASVSKRCDEIDRMADAAVARFSRSLSPESERLGQQEVAAAIEAFSVRVLEIAARSKKAICLAALAEMPAPTLKASSVGQVETPVDRSSAEGPKGSVEVASREPDSADSRVGEADRFVAAFEKITAESGEALAAIERKLKAPKRHVLYHDIERAIWSRWQIQPDDVTVHHINQALYLLALKSEGGVELDPLSCEAYGIDYSRLSVMMQASISNPGDLAAGPKVPRKAAVTIVNAPMTAVAGVPGGPVGSDTVRENGIPAASAPKKRGRPSTIDTARKEAALAARERGESWKDAAKLLYGTTYPTSQQVKNAPNVLNHYNRTRILPQNNS